MRMNLNKVKITYKYINIDVLKEIQHKYFYGAFYS